MSNYKITVRMKTAQSAATTPDQQLIDYYTQQNIPSQNWPESIRPAQQKVDTSNTPSPGSYANSYVDPRTGKTVYLDQNLQATPDNKPIYSQPKPSVPNNLPAAYINELNKNQSERNVSNPEYTQLAKSPSAATPQNMNPIRQTALQDQRQVRQNPVKYNYGKANSALYIALHDLNMENYNAVSLEANQDMIKSHIENRFRNNPQFKQLALNLLNDKINAAGMNK